MTNQSAARKNMVECQLMTTGLKNEGLIDSYRATPREMFVPESYRAVAYTDEAVPLGGGRWLMEPSLHARLLEAANPVSSDVVLDIGGGTGYSAAVLSPLVQTVLALECEPAFLDEAARIWARLDVCNAAGFAGDLAAGLPRHQPYSLILLNGAVCDIPGAILSQIAPGGRLLAVVRQKGRTMGEATLVIREGEGSFSRRGLFEAGTPWLAGFEPEPGFVF